MLYKLHRDQLIKHCSGEWISDDQSLWIGPDLEIDLVSGSDQDRASHIFDRDDYFASGEDKKSVLKFGKVIKASI